MRKRVNSGDRSELYYDNQSMIYQFLTFHLVLMKPFLDHLNCKRKKHCNDTDCLSNSRCLTDILRGFILNRQVTESLPPNPLSVTLMNILYGCSLCRNMPFFEWLYCMYLYYATIKNILNIESMKHITVKLLFHVYRS